MFSKYEVGGSQAEPALLVGFFNSQGAFASQVDDGGNHIPHVRLLVDQGPEHPGWQAVRRLGDVFRYRADLRISPSCVPEQVHERRTSDDQQCREQPQADIHEWLDVFVVKELVIEFLLPAWFFIRDNAVREFDTHLQ